jgi:hypothetical protein
MFDRYDIPFVYEMPIIIFDRNRHRVWRPYAELKIMWNMTSLPLVSSRMRTGIASGVFT